MFSEFYKFSFFLVFTFQPLTLKAANILLCLLNFQSWKLLSLVYGPARSKSYFFAIEGLKCWLLKSSRFFFTIFDIWMIIQIKIINNYENFIFDDKVSFKKKEEIKLYPVISFFKKNSISYNFQNLFLKSQIKPR